ncbi:signal peptidase II [uncultured Clostridium sp.]|uniref:signal peptidase II n=1 Tax=uncultured Clostridium sp. TaxID=59620 RepID=UPI00261F3C15|nr:signal peptidase II [uncultured Clostridium sp.]
MNMKKFLTIGILPLMWIAYFIFELLTGRIDSSDTIIGNLLLIGLFILVGFIIYKLTNKYESGLKGKTLISLFFIFLFIDQFIKLIIHFFFFNDYYGFFNDFLSFNPIINDKGSWLNARFGAGISFPVLILLNIIALFVFLEVYRYYKSKGNSDIYSDLAIVFIFTGALCSLIDKVFYGGSLDFIGISDLFIADIKDIYINLGIFFLILCLYNSGFFKDDENSTFKDDINSTKHFLLFIKADIKSGFKKKTISISENKKSGY